jgi:hypothetical protein
MKNWLIFFGMMLCVPVTAQTSISGLVIDGSSKQPIEFATVLLIHIPDSASAGGTATDKRGRFNIDNVKPGAYLLQCSFIGYDKIQTTSFVLAYGIAKQSVGQIQLNNTSKNLSEVTVTGRRSTLNTSIDRKVYNVDQDIMSRAGSASEILKNIPSVEVDIDGNVSLRGSGDMVVLINGKPSLLMGVRTRADVLQQLPANSIERIEVITNPSARYRPDGTSGIINIVLKKNIKNGFNGSATLNAGNRNRYNGNITLNYHPKKINLFGSYGIRRDNRKRFNKVERTYFDVASGMATSYYRLQSTFITRPFSHLVNGGFDYEIDEHNSFGISGSYRHRRQNVDYFANNQSFNYRNILSENYDRLRSGPEYEKENEGTGYFQHQFPQEDHGLRIEFNTAMEDET